MPQHRTVAVSCLLLAGLSQTLGCSIVSRGQPHTHGQTQPEVAIEHQYEARLSIDQHVLQAKLQPFIRHAGSGKFERYVTQNIAFKPIDELRIQIENDRGTHLKHRGEAHITVVTPPEFERISSHLSIDDINKLVEDVVQQISFEIVCLGMGELTQDHNAPTTYFLVVRSNGLAQLRHTISSAYLRAGGTAPAFRSGFFPHITIGFTERDLYESDGVKKNTDSCVELVKLD